MSTKLLSFALLVSSASAAQLVLSSSSRQGESPVTQIVDLLTELKTRIESDGQSEQQSYDKYACWCEDTLARKAGDISAAKELFAELETEIKKLKGEIAVHTAEIVDLQKSVAANLAAQKEATEVRQNGNDDYSAERTEGEQCIGALEAAIGVLNGAGAKRGFLETLQQAQVLSVVAGLKSLMKKPVAKRALSDDDFETVEKFVEKPEDFVSGSHVALSAVQIANNPFGDYAPQSTKIQGILKGMYDSFTADLEKANAEEAEAQKLFQALMATKKAEHDTLQATLERQTLDEAEKSKQASESRRLADDTAAQLKADEKFFAESKKACKAKAGDWAKRTRLRTEELNGMIQALNILSSPEAQATFANASATFLQTSSVSNKGAKARDEAFKRLKELARKTGDTSLANIAADLKTGGHFDGAMAACDLMIKMLREEEQDDIQHKDRCEMQMNKNANDISDLEHTKEMTQKELERMGDEETALKEKVTELEGQISATKADKEQLLEFRNKESADFVKALKTDSDAVQLIEKAIVFLGEFYKSNKISMGLVQKKKQDPEYTQDPDKAPETNFKSGDYGGRKGESGGIVAILSMVKEDLEMEIATGREEDAKAQHEYEKQRGTMTKALEAQEQTKAATETELAELQSGIAGHEEHKDQTGNDLTAQGELKDSLETDCAWVETHFDSRREKRKTEIDGLVDAKNYLAGVESGDEV
jgi:hypothetical protein